MNIRNASLDSPKVAIQADREGCLNKIARRLVLSRLLNLQLGQIVVSEDEGETKFGHLTEEFPLPMELRVLDSKFYSDIAFGGSIGAGEAYINGYWSSEDLAETLRILIRNRDVLERIDSGLARLSRPLQKIFHALNKNTRQGSSKNIAAHYDLGNEFYQL